MTYISPPGLEFWPIPISEQVWTDVLCIHSWDLDPDCGCGVGDHWVRSSRLPSGTSWECQRNVGLQWKILSKMDDLGVPESPKCWSNFQYISNLSDLSKSLNWPFTLTVPYIRKTIDVMNPTTGASPLPGSNLGASRVVTNNTPRFWRIGDSTTSLKNNHFIILHYPLIVENQSTSVVDHGKSMNVSGWGC